MGFSGGGSNILKNHTHDSTILQDGGNLNFQNITQSNMSAGSVTYSDGVHLQELVIGGAGEQLVVNPGATAPVWSTEHTQGTWQLIETYKAPLAANNYTFSFSAITPDDASALVLVYSMAATAALNLQLVVENIANNETNWIRIDSAAVTALQLTAQTQQQICSSTSLSGLDNTANGLVYIQKPDTGTQRPTITFQNSSQNSGAVEIGGGLCVGTSASFTDIEIKTSTSTWKADSIFSLYKILR